VIPIPGTRSPKRIEENIGALSVKLTAEECSQIEASIPEIVGDRYPGMSGTFNQKLDQL